MPQVQGAAANELSENTEPKCCQLQCFGRTVSLSYRGAVYFGIALPVALSVGLPVMLSVAGAAGGAAGVAAGVAAGKFAEYVYVKCRHVAHTDSPVQLSLLTSNAPETSGEPTETFSPVYFITLLPPPYTPEYTPDSPPAYKP